MKKKKSNFFKKYLKYILALLIPIVIPVWTSAVIIPNFLMLVFGIIRLDLYLILFGLALSLVTLSWVFFSSKIFKKNKIFGTFMYLFTLIIPTFTMFVFTIFGEAI